MGLLEEVKVTLKDKWLDYYQANQFWIKQLTEKYNCSSKTPDGGCRPYADFILGAISASEPRLAELLFHFFLVCDNRDRVIEVLGLNFDPDKELEKRPAKAIEPQQAEIALSSPDADSEYLKKLREEMTK